MEDLKCHDCGKLLKLNECYCLECFNALNDELQSREQELVSISELVEEQIGMAIKKGAENE